MNNAHIDLVWENYPSDKTAVNAQNLNTMVRASNLLNENTTTLDTTKATKTEIATLIKEIEFNESSGIFTITRKNGSKFTIDTKLEKIAINFEYDYLTQQIILTLIDGTTQYIDLSALITQYEFMDTDTVSFFADTTGKISAIVKEGSIEERHLQPNYLAEIKVEVAKAQASAANAEQSAEESSNYANLSKSYAVGGTGTRTGENTDNSKYYYEQSKNIYDNFESSGNVTGVKGNAETSYRTGNVNITPANIGTYSSEYIGKTFVPRKNSSACYNALADIYVSTGATQKYCRIEIPNVQSVFTMMQMELSIGTPYSADNFQGKLLIRTYHGSSSQTWEKFNCTAIGDNLSKIKVYGSDGKYLYIYGLGLYTNISIDKMLLGDSARYQDQTDTKMDIVDALPDTYQTATMKLLSNDYNDLSNKPTVESGSILLSDNVLNGQLGFQYYTKFGDLVFVHLCFEASTGVPKNGTIAELPYPTKRAEEIATIASNNNAAIISVSANSTLLVASTLISTGTKAEFNFAYAIN